MIKCKVACSCCIHIAFQRKVCKRQKKNTQFWKKSSHPLLTPPFQKRKEYFSKPILHLRFIRPLCIEWHTSQGMHSPFDPGADHRSKERKRNCWRMQKGLHRFILVEIATRVVPASLDPFLVQEEEFWKKRKKCNFSMLPSSRESFHKVVWY